MSDNYHLYKNLFRITWENVGSYLRVFTVFELFLQDKRKRSSIVHKASGQHRWSLSRFP